MTHTRCRRQSKIFALSAKISAEFDLHNVRARGIETRFAVAKIKLPQPLKCPVESQGVEFRAFLCELASPAAQSIRVVPTEIVLRKNGKPGALHFCGKARWAGQHAAGKNIALNKVDPKSVLCKQLVGNGDGLHQGATFGF